MHTRKRFLSILMAVVLCVGLLPASAMAATDESSDEAALQDLTEEDGIAVLDESTESSDADIPDIDDLEWGINLSKEATNLEYNEETEQLESTVTLHVEHDIDLVIVQDGTNLENETFSFLESLEQQTDIHVNAGLVIFGGTVPISWSSGELLDLSDSNNMEILDNALNYDGWDDVAGHSGSNVQAGIREARRMLDKDDTHDASDKFIIVMSDCAARMWIDEEFEDNEREHVYAQARYIPGTNQMFFDTSEDWTERYGQWISESHNVLGDSSPYLFDYPSFTDVWNAGVRGDIVDDDQYVMTYAEWLEKQAVGDLSGSIAVTTRDEPNVVTKEDYYSNYELATWYTAQEFVKAAQEADIHLISFSYLGYPLVQFTFGQYIDEFQEWIGELNNVTRHAYSLNSEAIFNDIMEDIETTEVGGGVIIDEIGETGDYDFDFIDEIERFHLIAGKDEYACTKLEVTDEDEDENGYIPTSMYGFGDANGSDDGTTYPFVLRYYEDGYTYTDEKSGEEIKYGECFVLELNTGISKYYYFNEETGELESGVSLTYDVTLTNPKTETGTYGEYDQYGQNNDGSDDYGLYTNNQAVLYPKDRDGNPEPPQDFPKPTVSYQSIQVEKEWEDEDDKDGIRPDSILVELIKDGEPTGKTITLSEDNEWKGGFAGLEIGSEGTEVDSVTVTDADDWNAIFNGLDKYDEDGNEIVYTFTEDPVEGYNTTVDGSVVTNTKTVNVSGSVIWNDDDDAAGVRPDSVTLHLCANGVLTGRETVTAEDDWEWSFDGLDKYAEDGAEIEYTITEDTVKGYTSEVDGYTVTNTYEPEEASPVSTLSSGAIAPYPSNMLTISGSVTWYDGDNAGGNRPESVLITLYGDGDYVDQLTVSAGDDWEWSFGSKARYGEDNEEIDYTITESAVDGGVLAGYSTTVSLSTIRFIIYSNTYEVTNIASTDVSGSATWVDNDNENEIRPNSLTVHLLAFGVPVEDENGDPIVVEVTAGDSWSWNFEGLDKYTEDGIKIVYTVTVDEVDGYNTKVHSYNVSLVEQTSASVGKFWNDGDNADDSRPESVTIHIYANRNVHEYSVQELDPYNELKDYTSTVYGDAENGYIITNILIKQKDVDADGDGEYGDSGVQVQVGDKLTYKIDYENPYDEAVTVTITDVLDEGLDFVEASDGSTYNNRRHMITWILEDVEPHTSGSVTFTATVNENALQWNEVENTAAVQIGDDSAVETNTVYNPVPDKDVDADGDGKFGDSGKQVQVGDELTYKINYQNSDNKAATVTITDVLDIGLDFVSASDGGTYDAATRTITWVLEDVAPHSEDSYYVTFTATVNEDALEKNEVVNTASVQVGDHPAQDTNTVYNPVPERIDISGTKTWVEEDGYTSDRPESITVYLLANGVPAIDDDGNLISTTVKPDEDGNWTYTFTDLLKEKDGQEITYTVYEEMLENYTPDYDGYDITNTHTPGKIAVTVNKYWEDEDNQDGKRPESITVELFANGDPVLVTNEDGESVYRTVTLDETNDWQATFDELAMYEDGEPISYTVEEVDAPEDYKSTIYPADPGDGEGLHYVYAIVNEYNPELTDIEVHKFWDDENDQDGIRPESINVTLTGTFMDGDDETECYSKTKTLDASSDWTAEFYELPVYHAEGLPITYTVTEDTITDGYEATMGEMKKLDDGSYLVEITNTHELAPEKTSLEVTKIWENDEDYNHRPDFIKVELIADDVETGKTITLNEDNDWSDTFTDLDAEENGEEIVYTVKEISDEALQYYTPKITYDDDGNATIVNYREFFDIDEEIVTDEDDRDSWVKNESVNEYNAIEIEMSTFLPVIETDELANGAFTMNFHEELDSELILDEADADFAVAIAGYRIDHKYYTVEIDPDDGCSFHVDVDLTALYLDGVITEEDLQGDTEIMVFFYADLEGTDLNGTYKSTVWYEVYDGEELEYTSDKDVVYVYTYDICIEKYDSETEEALAGATLGIYYDPECTEPVSRNGEAYAVVSGEEGTAMFYGLAEGTYYVTELEAPSGYVLSEEVLAVVLGEDLNDSDYTYVGRYANTPEQPNPDTVEVNGSKIWNDNNDQDGKRPDSITIHLLADGVEADSKTVSAADDWAWSFTDLPKYKDGQEIQYNITEDSVEDYSSEITPSEAGATTYTVTNSYTPEQTSLNVTKVWDDADDQDGMRPESITVALLADGVATGQTLVLDASNNWQGSFTELDVNTPVGQPITYTIEEVGVEEYTSDITGDAATGYVITNTHTPETVEVSGSKTWDDADDQDGKRPDSIRITLLADSVVVDTVTVSEADDWAWSFTDLAKYGGGKEITYTITEEEVEGYTTTYDGYNVINTHTPGTVSVPVTKIWDDEEDADGLRPDRVIIELFKNGEATGQLLTLDEDNDWTGSFYDLAEYTGGVKNVYTVQEQDVEGYTAEITGTADTVFVITNSHTPDKENPDNGNPDNGNPDNDGNGGSGDGSGSGSGTGSGYSGTGSGGTGTGGSSGSGTGSTGSTKTGDTNSMYLWIILMIVAAAAIVTVVTARMRRQRARK